MRNTVQFEQVSGDRPVDRVTEPYAVGQEFIMFLWADLKDGSLHIAAHSGSTTTESRIRLIRTARPAKDLVAEIGRLALATRWRRNGEAK